MELLTLTHYPFVLLVMLTLASIWGKIGRMRISVIGLPGSGKSTVARIISEKLSIPHVHIDRFWFQAGGRHGSHDTPNIEQVRAEVRRNTVDALNTGEWVSDGFYSRLQPEIANRADVVIYLDIPLWRRLFNHALRTVRRSQRHKELNTWDDVAFFPEIIRRTYTTVPKIREFISQYKSKVIILKSRKEINQYLASL